MLNLKICGNHLPSDLELLAKYEQRIEYIGFIFTPKSKRLVDPQLVSVWMKDFAFLAEKAVAVFLDQELEEVLQILQLTGIQHVQLHGQEEPFYCQQLRARCSLPISIWKVIAIEEGEIPSIVAYTNYVDKLLVDTKVAGVAGGTGQRFDWSLIPQLRLETQKMNVPLFIAGGIHANNVAELIENYELDGIDLASGVETDRVKDEAKLIAILEGVEDGVSRKKAKR